MDDLDDVMLFLDPQRHAATNREVRGWRTESREWPANQPRLRIAGELLAMSSLQQGPEGCKLPLRIWHAPQTLEWNFEGADEGEVLARLGQAFSETRLGLGYPYLSVLRLDVEAPRIVDVRVPPKKFEYRMVNERTYWLYGQKSAEEFRQACVGIIDVGLQALIFSLPAASLDD